MQASIPAQTPSLGTRLNFHLPALFYLWKWYPYISIFQGEASAVPGVARGDELATVSVGWFSFLLTWPSCSGVAAMASEQWPGHALLCQGWPLESLLVNGFKFWLPTCYCWLPTPIDWLLDREISVVLQQIWCFIIQCWVVVPLFKLVSYRLSGKALFVAFCEHAIHDDPVST